MRHIDKTQKKARYPCGGGLNPILEKLEETEPLYRPTVRLPTTN